MDSDRACFMTKSQVEIAFYVGLILGSWKALFSSSATIKAKDLNPIDSRYTDDILTVLRNKIPIQYIGLDGGYAYFSIGKTQADLDEHEKRR